MKYIQEQLNGGNSVALSLEEIAEEIETTEVPAEQVEEAVEVVAETPAVGEESEDPIDQEESELDDEIESYDESTTELETGADVAERLEETTQVMESLIDQVGAVSLVEYTSMSEFATTQMARLGIKREGFALEGIDDDASRMANLRLSLEAIKADTAAVKKAVQVAGKKVDEQSVSLWDKLLALVGVNAKRAKVLSSKVAGLGEAKREEIKLSSRLSGSLVNQDTVETAQAVNKACSFFYGKFFGELRDYAARKTDTVPEVPAGILDGLPGNPQFILTESKAEFESGAIKAPAATVKVMSKAEIKRTLDLIVAVAGSVRSAGLMWGGFGTKVAQLIAGEIGVNGGMAAGAAAGATLGGGVGALVGMFAGSVGGGLLANKALKVLSRGHRTEIAVVRAYRYFAGVISNLLKVVSAHMAAYN